MLLSSKLLPPGISRPYVSRARLLSLVSERLSAGFLLVSAPAGFGKTTLISEFADREKTHDQGMAVSWYTVAREDNDPARFVAYLSAALQRIEPAWAKQASLLLQAPEPPGVARVAASLIADIESDHAPFLLVIDEYQHICSRTVHEMVGHLLEHRPAPLHIVLISREDPPLALARWRAGRRMSEIREVDLRFTTAETARFLETTLSSTLDPASIEALQARTEGWAVGLQLAALSMQGRPDPAAFVRSFTGTHRFVLDYLLDEVLAQQPERIQTFLLQTSVLERFSPALCDAVTESNDSAGILLALEQANLFLIPLDDSRAWFRYHQLFTDLLRHQFDLRLGNRRPLLQRAAAWYRAAGYENEAVEYALRAEDWDTAADNIETTDDRLLRLGEAETLRRWLAALPAETITARPNLCYRFAWVLVLAGEVVEARPFLKLAEDAGLAGRPVLLGRVRALQAHISRVEQAHADMVTYSLEALLLLPEEEHSTRAVVQLNLGVTLLMGGRLEQGEEALRAAIREARNCRNEQVRVIAVSFLARLLAARGRLHQAAELIEGEVIRQSVHMNDVAPALIDLAAVHLMRHLVVEADARLQEAMVPAQRGQIPDVLAGAFRLRAMLERERGDETAVQVALRVGRVWAERATMVPGVQEALDQTAVELALEQGAPAAAFSSARHASPSADIFPALLALPGVLIPMPGILHGRIMLHQGAREEAEHHFADCAAAAREAGLITGMVPALVWQSAAAATPEEGLPAMLSALELAAREDIRRPFLVAGAHIVPVLQLAAAREHVAEFATQLLASIAHRSATAAKPEAARSAPAENCDANIRHSEPLEPLSARELEILALLATRRTNAEIAAHLSLSLNTVKSHLQHIYQKLDVHNRREAGGRAQQLGLLP